MKIPQDVSYEELGHDNNEFPAFSPDYTEEDIGKDFDLTVTIFGYQLGLEEIVILTNALHQHIFLNTVHCFMKGRLNE